MIPKGTELCLVAAAEVKPHKGTFLLDCRAPLKRVLSYFTSSTKHVRIDGTM